MLGLSSHVPSLCFSLTTTNAATNLQVVAAALAESFNTRGPPKPIAFIMPFVIELLHRDGRPLYNVEPLLHGEYEKHNDNSGGVYQSTQLHFQRNTPQAFSHFTWEASGKKCVVCDIQGVGDLYTDPQVHTTDGNGFGQGNCGELGINKFLGSHRCNEICTYFGLSPIRMESVTLAVTWPPGAQEGQVLTIIVHGCCVSRNTRERIAPVRNYYVVRDAPAAITARACGVYCIVLYVLLLLYSGD